MTEKPFIEIAGRRIGPNYPPYVICELSGNHNGSLERALHMMEVAADTGCDAIKLQTYTPDTMTIDCDKPEFMIKGGLWDGRQLYELYQEAHTPFEWHEALFAKGKELGVTVFSTPFDVTACDLLEELDAPAYKIASFEVTDSDLVAHIAKKGKPIIMSTGLASMGDIERAVNILHENGAKDIVLLHCISSYPAPVDQANLLTIPHLGAAFGIIVGLSDHTHGSAVAVASIALGACVIEKHFTTARSDGGPDSAFSLEPNEFKRLCDEAKIAWQALGKIGYNLKKAEKANVKFRRSIYAVKDIKKGEVLTKFNIRVIRPGFGLSPHYLDDVLERCAREDIERGTPISWAKIG